MELVVAVTGASGAILGVKFVERSRELGIKINLIFSEWGEKTLMAESGEFPQNLVKDGIKLFDNNDLLAPFSSGSYPFDGMVIIPCSMNTLSKIASGAADDLITRTASVALKERRKLVLITRETPLSLIHLENMVKLARAGAVILPPVLTFYHFPKTIDDMVNYVIGKVLDQFNVKHNLFKRWNKGR